jgi:hypothetical protein
MVEHTQEQNQQGKVTPIWNFNYSRDCRSWGPYKTTYWGACKNTSNSKRTYQATNGWHNDMKSKNFFYWSGGGVMLPNEWNKFNKIMIS